MCTVVILRRPGHQWPVIIAANRDEMRDRPWRPPARHWPDRQDVVAGYDETAGGSWLGINDFGLVAAVMNREGNLGPLPDKRSRGELPLEALDHADAADAAQALGALDGRAWRPFNLLVADNRDAFWLKSTGEGPVECRPVPEGVSMIAARDLNDPGFARIAAFLPRFRAAPVPDPDTGDWTAWKELAAAGRPSPESIPRAAMSIDDIDGYGTVSGSLIALPAPVSEFGQEPARPVWLFCGDRPGTAEYRPVDMDGEAGKPAHSPG